MTEGMFVFGSTASRPLSPSQCRAGASGSVTTSPKAEDDAVRPAAWRLPGKLNLGIVFPDRCKPRIGLPFGVRDQVQERNPRIFSVPGRPLQCGRVFSESV